MRLKRKRRMKEKRKRKFKIQEELSKVYTFEFFVDDDVIKVIIDDEKPIEIKNLPKYLAGKEKWEIKEFDKVIELIVDHIKEKTDTKYKAMKNLFHLDNYQFLSYFAYSYLYPKNSQFDIIVHTNGHVKINEEEKKTWSAYDRLKSLIPGYLVPQLERRKRIKTYKGLYRV